MNESVSEEKVSSTASLPQKDTSLILYLVSALTLALVIRFFVATPYLVDGTSMDPNFHTNDYLIVDRLTYDISTPKRGDVIVLKLPQNTSRDLIKRVIGLPGETVVLSGPNPTVTIINATHPNGFILNEPYIISSNYGGSSDTRYTLGTNEYFALGDNRRVSADSRTWGILPRSDIIGRAFIRLFPFNQISFFPGGTSLYQLEQ